MLFNLEDTVSHHLMRRIGVIMFKAFLPGEPQSTAVTVTAVQPSVWYVLTMGCEQIHMNTMTGKQPYDELSEQMEKCICLIRFQHVSPSPDI